MRARSARTAALLGCLIAAPAVARAEDGYELWLRYRTVADPVLLKAYRASITGLAIEGSSPTLRAAREEAIRGLRGLLGVDVPLATEARRDGLLVAAVEI